MRKPKIPPDTEMIFKKIQGKAGKLVLILRAASAGPLASGKYLHWDELLHRDPPKGLTHDEWWCALKMHRQSEFKDVPLHDKNGAPFKYLEAAPIPEGLHDIDLKTGGRIQMPEQITTPETRDRYYVGSLIEEAITSSQLEGASTTRQVAKEMIRAGRPPRDRSEQMILNNFVTMRQIGTLRDEPLTRDLVFEIHRAVTEETLKDPSAAGRFRRPDEETFVGDDSDQVFHVPPPADQLGARMGAMCDFANGKTPRGFVHPVVRSIILHFWLAYDHPFIDGNGRTARALFYWSMLHHGYWLFEFVSISQILLKAPAKYGRAFLYTETDENDLTYFIMHQLDTIQRAIQGLHEYIKRKTRQLQAAEHELRGSAGLNHRQRALISHALRHPHHRYTIHAHQMSHAVVYQTGRTDLLDLRDRGLFDARKIGRTWYFTPVDTLEEKLARLQ